MTDDLRAERGSDADMADVLNLLIRSKELGGCEDGECYTDYIARMLTYVKDVAARERRQRDIFATVDTAKVEFRKGTDGKIEMISASFQDTNTKLLPGQTFEAFMSCGRIILARRKPT